MGSKLEQIPKQRYSTGNLYMKKVKVTKYSFLFLLLFNNDEKKKDGLSNNKIISGKRVSFFKSVSYDSNKAHKFFIFIL